MRKNHNHFNNDPYYYLNNQNSNSNNNNRNNEFNNNYHNKKNNNNNYKNKNNYENNNFNKNNKEYNNNYHNKNNYNNKHNNKFKYKTDQNNNNYNNNYNKTFDKEFNNNNNNNINNNDNDNNYNNYYNNNNNAKKYNKYHENHKRPPSKKNNKKYNNNNYNNNNYINDNNYNNNNNYNNKINNPNENDNIYSYNDQENLNNEKKNTSFISKKVLNTLKIQNIEEIIDYCYRLKEIYKTINNTNWDDDMLIIMINILVKIINVNSEPSNQIITSIIDNSKLYDEFIKYLKKQDIKNKVYLDFLFDFLKFLRKIYDKFSNYFERLSEQINFLDNAILILNEYINMDNIRNNAEVYTLLLDIISLYNEIKEIKKDLLKKKFFGKNNIDNNNNNNNINSDIKIDYKETSVIISSDEIYNNITKKIGKHIPKGPYGSVEQYINTLFYLEYEDCYRSLRNSIENIKNAKNNTNNYRKIEKENRDIYYYINAYIIGFDISKNGILLTIDFEAIQRVIKFTKRMIFGSLLLLTDDNNQDYLLVTVYFNPYVANRNLKDKNKNEFKVPKPPRYRIQAQLVNINKESFNFILEKRNKKLQIFESKAYFESYIYTLKRLKKMVVKDIPFQNELIRARFNKDDMLPYFIAHNRFLSYNGETIIVKENQYPQSLINSLDESQFNAIKVCLNNEIGIIQGPPGTGKTHVGAILTHILLQNIKSPILIVCFTNHALDQFIEHLIPFTSNIVRIGGRCSNENVKRFQLNKQGRYYDKNVIGVNKDIERICDEISDLSDLLNAKKKLEFNDFNLYYKDMFDKIKKDFFSMFYEFKKVKIPDNILFKLWSDQMELEFFIEKNFIYNK